MPHLFKFRTIWRLPAPLPVVWDAIKDVRDYPHWWPGISQVEVSGNGPLSITVGMKTHYVVKSPLYTLQYQTELIEFKQDKYIFAKSTGDLVGTGTWTFIESPHSTEAIFDWHVTVTPPFLRFVSHIPGVKSIMRFFHNRFMSQGEAALKKLIEQK